MLTIENLQVKYGDFIAVSDVSMEAPKGQITALIGAPIFIFLLIRRKKEVGWN